MRLAPPAPMAEQAARIGAEERKVRRSLVTPEGVDLSLRLATGGQRVSAFLLDLLIMIAILILGTVLIWIGAVSFGFSAAQPAAIIWLLGFFLLRNGYFILQEMGPRAATFGKRATGLRVVSRSGARLTADAVIARNLMREIEIFLPLSFLGFNAAEGTATGMMTLAGFAWASTFLLFPLFNRDRLRIGDLLAGTWVISAPKRGLGLELARGETAAPRSLFTTEQLDAYGVFELQTLEKVLRTGNSDAIDAVAHTIRSKIGSPPFETNAEFLRAYYEALRAHLERKLLFGKRRRDKFDR
jgi:uncharacterized RDD family membrane protein YckC